MTDTTNSYLQPSQRALLSSVTCPILNPARAISIALTQICAAFPVYSCLGFEVII